MRIEVGEYYMTAGGQKVGPMELWSESVEHPFRVAGLTHHFTSGGDLWRVDGTSDYCGKSGQIVAIWTEGPIRTVTRQEIIPGTYDGVVVSYEHDHRLTVSFMVERPSSDALTRAVAVLTALAGALRDE